jgi:hypothetical protein
MFWDIMLCSPLKVNRRLGGTCRLHFQGRRPLIATRLTLVSCLAYFKITFPLQQAYEVIDTYKAH